MLDSVTIFTKGGTVLYHSQPSKIHHAAPLQQSEKENVRVNAFISSVLLLGEGTNASAGEGSKNRVVLSSSTTVGSPVVVEWLDGATTIDGVSSAEDRRNWIALAVYPEVASRKLQQNCVGSLLLNAMKRYAVFYEHHKQQGKRHANSQWNTRLLVPPQDQFESAFQSILRELQEEVSSITASNNSLASMEKKQKQKHQSMSASNKRGKEKTVWHDGKGKITKEALDQLDMSKDKESSAPFGEVRQDQRAIAEAKIAYLPTEGERPAWEEPDTVLDDVDIGWSVDAHVGQDAMQEHIGGVRNFFSKLLSPNKPLTKPDLEPPLNQMKLLLTSKNVSPKTAKAICDCVQDQLLGKQVGTLTGVKRAVRHALEDAIEKILRPELGNGRLSFQKGKSLDVLRGVVEKRGGVGMVGKQKRPYVICMIGINGVGKSTSLAKIAYYLQSNKCKPMLAACDTFRSGAVEQLSVHASCLGLPLFHQGYAKDPSAVAKAAIAKAAADGNDVVLVDTAGRMQNNLPLMKALAKLVTETKPDLVLFVCEALVGTDGLDQLTMFQKALSSGGHLRPIDGIVLTKFDTVSDKVGAALTLTHLTGVPIAFCGTGQKYNHLKPLSVPYVISSLFS